MQAQHFFRRHWRLPFFLLAAIAAAALLQKTVFAPVPVRGERLIPRDLTAEVYGNGTVEAKVLVPVSTRLTARILAVHADQGDLVREGQLLAELDASDVTEQARAAEAQARAAAASLRAEEAGLGKARANLRLAEKNVLRYRALAASNLVAPVTAEQFENVWQLAGEEVQRGVAGLDAAREQGRAAVAAHEAARVRLADTRIVAPMDGLVISREQEPGAMATPGAAILRVVDPASLWVKAYVDEALLAGVSVGRPAVIFLRSAPGERFAGRVARVARESDRETEELEVNVVFSVPRADPRVGEQAEVLIATGRVENALSLPVAALARQGRKAGVWVVREGRLAFREVAFGVEDRSGFVEVRSGLAADETVAVSTGESAGKFKEGARVRVLP